MKQQLNSLSRQYVGALRKHLKEGPRAKFLPAVALGRRTVVLGLETLDLARIHEHALVVLKLTDNTAALVKRAENFFTEAMGPIIETHRMAREDKMELQRLTEQLGLRTVELAVTNRLLREGVARRKMMENALHKSGAHYARLLKNSLQLQEGLRQLAHQVLAAQEAKRHKISLELQDEIAQTLLGINARLLTLKKEARSNTSDLKNEITSTQRLVTKSAQSVRRAARNL